MKVETDTKLQVGGVVDGMYSWQVKCWKRYMLASG